MSARRSKAQRALSGTIRKDRDRPYEPILVPGSPAIDHTSLTAIAKALLPQFLSILAPTGKLTPDNGPAFAAMIEDYAEMLDCRRMIEKEGRFYTTTNEKTGCLVHRVHPAVGVLSAADKRFRAYAESFGMTPGARLKVSAIVEGEVVKNPFDDI